jgi:hypothetical protein
VLNCQLGIAVFLAGARGSCPVNWRLLLPRSWDTDPGRRKLAHLPDDEHHRPAWQYMLDAIDEMAAEWSLDQLPVLADLSGEPHVDPVLRGLDERRIPYLVRVAANRPSVTVRSNGTAPRTMSPAELIGEPARQRLILLNGTHGGSGLAGPKLQAKPLPAAGPPGNAPGARQRYIIAEWPLRQRGPWMTWLTTLEGRQLGEVPGKLALNEQVNADVARLSDQSGLRHFEGRSFRGWHHHVTLVSIAHAYQLAAMPQQSLRTAL